jgi:ParB family chromosome partitioning protein
MIKKTSVLGQGLAAILRDIDTQSHVEKKNPSVSGYEEIDIKQLNPSPFQPRKIFNDEELVDLSNSIKENGVLQPLIVRKVSDNNYEIIAGERRWRAATQAGLKTIPSIVRLVTDEEAVIIALVENIQREALTPLEEAEGLQKLSQTMGESQEEIAQMIGKSRSYVANTLRLNNLPEAIKDLLRNNKINAGVARSLVGHPNALELATLAMENNLNVRELENLAQKMKKSHSGEHSGDESVGDEQDASHKKKDSAKSVFLEGDQERIAAEKAIENALGLKAKLVLGPKKNVLSVYFDTMEQLDALLEKLTF